MGTCLSGCRYAWHLQGGQDGGGVGAQWVDQHRQPTQGNAPLSILLSLRLQGCVVQGHSMPAPCEGKHAPPCLRDASVGQQQVMVNK